MADAWIIDACRTPRGIGKALAGRIVAGPGDQGADSLLGLLLGGALEGRFPREFLDDSIHNRAHFDFRFRRSHIMGGFQGQTRRKTLCGAFPAY